MKCEVGRMHLTGLGSCWCYSHNEPLSVLPNSQSISGINTIKINSMDWSEYNWLNTVLVVGPWGSGVEILGSDFKEFLITWWILGEQNSVWEEDWNGIYSYSVMYYGVQHHRTYVFCCHINWINEKQQSVA